jgi:hypothetical protein
MVSEKIAVQGWHQIALKPLGIGAIEDRERVKLPPVDSTMDFRINVGLFESNCIQTKQL